MNPKYRSSDWSGALFLGTYILVVTFVVRFIFGAHTLWQAGTEALTVGALTGFLYGAGWYQSWVRSSGGRELLHIISGGVIMWTLGCWVNSHNPASFTSDFFLVCYTLLAMFMTWLGFETQLSEAWERFLIENDMA